jgi:hypothetical protein
LGLPAEKRAFFCRPPKFDAYLSIDIDCNLKLTQFVLGWKICTKFFMFLTSKLFLEAKGVYRMSFQAFETPSSHAPASTPVQGRRHWHAEDSLILTELSPHIVIDHRDDAKPINLTTFGTLREACPKCTLSHLHLILRQRNVRTAHLFCAECHSCFDAHYASGAPALVI